MYLRCLKFGAVVVFLASVLCACEREERRFTEDPAASQAPNSIALSALQPGTTTGAQESPYEYNAYAIAQGKQLFEWFNCSGCHAQGGGAIGPALMDAQWIYGDQPQNIFSTIVEGRPNGMPSFRGRIPTQQVWQLVAYVRSLSGQVSKDAAPSRSDHLFMKKSEQSSQELTPSDSSPPAPH
jgi:cytochrome c oxidase cbb3-type subunit III